MLHLPMKPIQSNHRLRGRLACLALGALVIPVLMGSSREIPAVDLDLDSLASGDIQIFQGSTAVGVQLGETWVRAELGGGWFGVDYVPVDFDLFGRPERLEESRVGVGLHLARTVDLRWTILADASAYEGFQSYRSAWVSRWYTQFFEGLPGLRTPDPAGLAGGMGLRHETIPTRLWIQVESALALDRIAPGHAEILDENGSLINVRPLRRHLDTRSHRLGLEVAVTPWLKTRSALRVADQVERRPRWSSTGEAYFALGPDWVLRLDGGYT